MNTIQEVRKLNGRNKSLSEQTRVLREILNHNESFTYAFRVLNKELDEYYIGAGCVAQTVWNYLSDKPIDYGISDFDIIYYDASDLSKEAEKNVEDRISSLLRDVPYEIDVKNEARVHLWYEEKFGKAIEPYESVKDAINSWPSTATAIGVRTTDSGEFEVYAPFGLNDLFGMLVRPNKALITRDIYEKKASKWAGKWSDLVVVPWDE